MGRRRARRTATARAAPARRASRRRGRAPGGRRLRAHCVRGQAGSARGAAAAAARDRAVSAAQAWRVPYSVSQAGLGEGGRHGGGGVKETCCARLAPSLLPLSWQRFHPGKKTQRRNRGQRAAPAVRPQGLGADPLWLQRQPRNAGDGGWRGGGAREATSSPHGPPGPPPRQEETETPGRGVGTVSSRSLQRWETAANWIFSLCRLGEGSAGSSLPRGSPDGWDGVVGKRPRKWARISTQ